jgi:hypothetical protein
VGDRIDFNFGDVERPADLLRERFPWMSAQQAADVAEVFGPDVAAVLSARSVRKQAVDSLFESEKSDALMEMLSKIYGAKDSKRSVGCLFFAMGRPPFGVASMRKLAERHGVSVEAISNEVEDFQLMLNLPRTEQQKSPTACAVYVLSNGAQPKGAKAA